MIATCQKKKSRNASDPEIMNKMMHTVMFLGPFFNSLWRKPDFEPGTAASFDLVSPTEPPLPPTAPPNPHIDTVYAVCKECLIPVCDCCYSTVKLLENEKKTEKN
jgi:hypothetical protein